MIWEYSFKYKTSGGPWSQKKEDMEPWTSHSMSRLKLKMPFDLLSIPSHTYHEFHDYLRIFFQIEVIWRTLKSKEGIYGALNFTWHVTFEIWNTFWSYFLPFLIIFFHKGNDYLNFYFQIQVLWRTLHSKEGIYGSLNFS